MQVSAFRNCSGHTQSATALFSSFGRILGISVVKTKGTPKRELRSVLSVKRERFSVQVLIKGLNSEVKLDTFAFSAFAPFTNGYGAQIHPDQSLFGVTGRNIWNGRHTFV